MGEKYRSALLTLMQAAEKLGDLATWQRAGELAFRFDPNDSVLGFSYAQALAAAGRRKEAVAQLETVFRIRPSAPQILRAMEALLVDEPSSRLEALRSRHLEALALCMSLPAWMRGNLVATDWKHTTALDLQLVVNREVTVTGPIGFQPSNLYLVLPRMPELEVLLPVVRLRGAAGEIIDLVPDPQGNLTPLPDGFMRITPTDAAGLDDPAVINFPLPSGRPPGVTFEVRLFCRPAPAIATIMETFGTWRHPGVKAALSD